LAADSPALHYKVFVLKWVQNFEGMAQTKTLSIAIGFINKGLVLFNSLLSSSHFLKESKVSATLNF
jgi:hypothetical protein